MNMNINNLIYHGFHHSTQIQSDRLEKLQSFQIENVDLFMFSKDCILHT